MDRGRGTELERALDGACWCARRLLQVELAREAVQRLELLQRVALDADAQALADDGVEIDEAPARSSRGRARPRASRGGP